MIIIKIITLIRTATKTATTTTIIITKFNYLLPYNCKEQQKE